MHRDVKLDNVLVCRSDFSRVKLCDFGETRKAHSYVQRRYKINFIENIKRFLQEKYFSY